MSRELVERFLANHVAAQPKVAPVTLPLTQPTPEPTPPRNDALLNLQASVDAPVVATPRGRPRRQPSKNSTPNKPKRKAKQPTKPRRVTKAKTTPAAPATKQKTGTACSMHHLDWVDLREVTHPRQYLLPGCYLHGKHCRECNVAIATVVTKRQKVYHCPPDFRAFDLRKQVDIEPCHCIVCATCCVKVSEQHQTVGRRCSTRMVAS